MFLEIQDVVLNPSQISSFYKNDHEIIVSMTNKDTHRIEPPNRYMTREERSEYLEEIKAQLIASGNAVLETELQIAHEENLQMQEMLEKLEKDLTHLERAKRCQKCGTRTDKKLFFYDKKPLSSTDYEELKEMGVHDSIVEALAPFVEP